MRRRPWVGAATLLVVVAGLSGCVGPDEDLEPTSGYGGASEPPADDGGPSQAGPAGDAGGGEVDHDEAAPQMSPARGPALTFGRPVQINRGGGAAFEPSLDVGPTGTVYVTAPPSPLVGSGSLHASFLWRSKDSGASWEPMPSPADIQQRLPALEGDTAVDATGNVYFVDTYAADNTFSRWDAGDEWAWSRPLHGTPEVDDRPWLVAHGDGIVYYIGNHIFTAPAPNNDPDDRTDWSRIWFQASYDGGLTWTPGYGVGRSLWCNIAASPVDDRTVALACTRGAGIDGLGTPVGPFQVIVLRSTDRGATWDEEVVADADGEPSGYPSVAFDRGGALHVGWIDRATRVGSPEQRGRSVWIASRAAETWTTYNVTPMRGSFANLWFATGGPGDVAAVLHGANTTAPDASTEWRIHALVGKRLGDGDVGWRSATVDAEPVATDHDPPGHFFQAASGPDGHLHVAYERAPGRIMHVRSNAPVWA